MRKINIYGTASTGQGYSGCIEQIAVSLNKTIDVSLVSFNKVPISNISPKLSKIKSKVFTFADVGLVIGFPSAFDSCNNKFRVGYTMFETNKLPTGEEWAGKYGNPARMINESLDLLIVPCEHNEYLFKKSGVTIPIEVVPLGVDTETFKYIERNTLERDTFTFLMYGTLTLRKNPGMVISAFASLFRHNKNVKLVLKTQQGTLGHVQYEDMGNIQVIDELWTPERLMQEIAKSDCFVFPSRGEGFGLPPLEAMATGLPTIMSDNTGMSEYANTLFNIPIPTKELRPALRYPTKWGDVGTWHEPDYEYLKKAMLQVYNNKKWAYEMGINASNWVNDKWGYNKTAEKLIKAIEKHYLEWER